MIEQLRMLRLENLCHKPSAQLKVACDKIDRVTRLLAWTFVASSNDFHNQPVVVNAASDLMVAAFATTASMLGLLQAPTPCH